MNLYTLLNNILKRLSSNGGEMTEELCLALLTSINSPVTGTLYQHGVIFTRYKGGTSEQIMPVLMMPNNITWGQFVYSDRGQDLGWAIKSDGTILDGDGSIVYSGEVSSKQALNKNGAVLSFQSVYTVES